MSTQDVRTDEWRAVIAADGHVAWFKRAIARSGKRMTWRPCGIGRYDAQQGFWGGLPHRLTDTDRHALEALAAR